MAYIQHKNPFPITSCGRRRAGGVAAGFDESRNVPPFRKLDKSKMACNKPRRSPKPQKKKVVKACEGGKEKIIH